MVDIRLHEITIDCVDVARVAPFWAALLGGELFEPMPGWLRLPARDGTPMLNFQPVPEPKTGKARVHLDLLVDGLDNLDEAVARVVALGGSETGERHEYAEGTVVVLGDPGRHRVLPGRLRRLIPLPRRRSMTTWTAAELEQLAAAEELEIAPQLRDGTLRPWTPIWVVRAGDEIYVRTWHRRDTGWFGRVVASGRARIRVPGLETGAVVDDVGGTDEDVRDGVDAAYRAKYGRYGAGTVGRMVGDGAAAATLRLTPQAE